MKIKNMEARLRASLASSQAFSDTLARNRLVLLAENERLTLEADIEKHWDAPSTTFRDLDAVARKVYIAGPMTGIEEFNFPAFFEAEERWAAAGWLVVNPARLDVDLGFDPTVSKAESLEAYMKRDLPEVAGCDAIALLPGWRKSSGAPKELTVARWCWLAVYDATTMALLPDETALEEAQRLVFGPRQAAYGHPADDFGRTGRLWGALLGLARDVTAAEVAICMVALKLSRETNKPGRDNMVDAAGYVGTLELVRQREAVA